MNIHNRNKSQFLIKEKECWSCHCNDVVNGVSVRGVVVNTTAQLHSTKPELGFSTGSNPARSESQICDGENLSQCSPVFIDQPFRQNNLIQLDRGILQLQKCCYIIEQNRIESFFSAKTNLNELNNLQCCLRKEKDL